MYGTNDLDTLTVQAMNTNFYVALPKGITNWKKPIKQLIQYVATEWSRFQEGNELAMVNQLNIGETIKVSPILFDCLKQADEYFIRTDGLFSPYLKIQMEHHGYNQSFPFRQAKSQSNQPLARIQSP